MTPVLSTSLFLEHLGNPAYKDYWQGFFMYYDAFVMQVINGGSDKLEHMGVNFAKELNYTFWVTPYNTEHTHTKGFFNRPLQPLPLLPWVVP